MPQEQVSVSESLIHTQPMPCGASAFTGQLLGLLDGQSKDEATVQEAFAGLDEVEAAGALEAHDFRTRQAGPASFLEFHLVVPGAMTVAEAHDICDRIETALKAEMPGVVITIHVEPDGKAKHEGVLVPPMASGASP